MARGRGQVDMDDIELYEVKTPSGNPLRLQTEDEARFYNDNKKKYLDEYKITNASDIQEVERILVMEIMVHRWSTWLTQGFDYDEGLVSAEELRRNIKDYSGELRQCKESLGIDRVTRNKDKGEDVATYIDKLRQRAKEFGVMRNAQAAKAIQLFKEAETLIGTFERTDRDEQEHLRLNKDEIFKWFCDVAIPEFNEIDKSFRENNQKYWVRDV